MHVREKRSDGAANGEDERRQEAPLTRAAAITGSPSGAIRSSWRDARSKASQAGQVTACSASRMAVRKGRVMSCCPEKETRIAVLRYSRKRRVITGKTTKSPISKPHGPTPPFRRDHRRDTSMRSAARSLKPGTGPAPPRRPQGPNSGCRCSSATSPCSAPDGTRRRPVVGARGSG